MENGNPKEPCAEEGKINRLVFRFLITLHEKSASIIPMTPPYIPPIVLCLYLCVSVRLCGNSTHSISKSHYFNEILINHFPFNRYQDQDEKFSQIV